MSLTLAPDLKLPIAAVTEKLGFLGRTGSGKSYAAMRLAEEMALGRLRTLRFLGYPDSGSIVAQPVLFLEGGR